MGKIVYLIIQIIVITCIFAIAITASYFGLPNPIGVIIGFILFIVYDVLFMTLIDKFKKRRRKEVELFA